MSPIASDRCLPADVSPSASLGCLSCYA